MHFQPSPYLPPLLFKSGHFNTITTNLWRSWRLGVDYQRRRINTPDGDFLDLDFSCIGSQKILLLVHGLEGDAYSAYMKGMVKAANESGWDTLSLNLRGCSGELNQKPVTYHSGKTEDIGVTVKYLCENCSYEEVALTGFSLGGNLILKFAGELGDNLPSMVKVLAAISVPFDLEKVAQRMDNPVNRFYRKHFLTTLKQNALRKINQYPDVGVSAEKIRSCQTFYEFDNVFTAPVNGFADAETYWRECSSLHFLQGITRHTLMINAMDDPFIGKAPIPFEEIQKNENLQLITTERGGHVGFGNWRLSRFLWHESQVIKFLNAIAG